MKRVLILVLAIFPSLTQASTQQAGTQSNITTGCPPTAKKLFALPGNGFCSLRNIELNPVFAVTYHKCQLIEKNDGTWLIPDHLHLVPKDNSDVVTSVEIIDHYHNYTDITATQMGADAAATYGKWNIGGSFSRGYKRMKKSQVEDKSVTTRVSARYLLFSARFDEYSVELDPDLKLKLNDAIAALKVGNETRASLLLEMTLLSHGTHSITGVDLGGLLVKEDYISKAYRTLYETDQHTLTVSASIGFSDFFGAKASYNKQTYQAQYDEYVKNIKSTRVQSYGGVLYTPALAISTWVDSVASHLVTIDRSGLPLHYLITPRHFPHANQTILSSLRKKLLGTIENFNKINLHAGCVEPTSPNFDYNANVGDKSCLNPPTSCTFGGAYQACSCTSGSEQCVECMSYTRNNYLTGALSCPEYFTPVLLNSKYYPNCWESCSMPFLWEVCEENCKSYEYKTYWCAAINNEQIPKNTGLMFGGVFTSTASNPVTNGQSCPPFYNPTRILQDLTVCSSADYEPGSRYSIPFGGFFSCKQGNPLALAPKGNISTLPLKALLENAKPTCADGYSQHAAAIDNDCLINYCVKANSFGYGQKEIPIMLPPFQNYDILFAELSNRQPKKSPIEGGSIAAIILGVLLALVLLAMFLVLFAIPKYRANRLTRGNTSGDEDNVVAAARPLLDSEENEGGQDNRPDTTDDQPDC